MNTSPSCYLRACLNFFLAVRCCDSEKVLFLVLSTLGFCTMASAIFQKTGEARSCNRAFAAQRIKFKHALNRIITGIALLCFFSACSDDKLFKPLSARSTGIAFSNDVEETQSVNILNYLYMYNGGGVAVGDVNNDQLPDIYFTANQQSNKLYLNKGNFSFEDITEKAGVEGAVGPSVWTNGVSMVDINADGWLDIYVCRMHGFLEFEGGNELFVNNGDGTFTEQAAKYGLDTKSYAQQAAFFDFDLDGDLDMFLVNQSIRTPSTYKPGAARAERDSLGGDRLYENQNNFFVDISEEAGIYGGAMGYGLALSIGDLNNDNYPDIYVANDFHENDYLYFNQGDGPDGHPTFIEKINESMGHTSTFSMGNDIADINNDGLLDIFTIDMKPDKEEVLKMSMTSEAYSTYKFRRNYGYHDQYPRNMLQINQGNLFGTYASFSEVGEFYGVDATDWSWGTLIADFDMDGNKDIFITNGIPRRPNDLDYIKYTSDEFYDPDSLNFKEVIEKMPDGKVPNVAYRNKGNGFEDVSSMWGLNLNGYSNGTAYADFDNDGDWDLVLNNLNAQATIYKNTASDRKEAHFLKVKLIGNKGNDKGFGARVTIELNNALQTQELFPVRGWLSSVEPVLIFGLGENELVDRVEVDWKNGKKTVVNKIKANTEIVLDYSKAVAEETETATVSPIFSPQDDQTIIDYSHEENDYIDFDYEALIPRMLSTEGPRMAVGDVNNDGLQDVYIGGAKNQAGKLYVQQKSADQPFLEVDSDVFYKDRAEEDVEATFLDANLDGLPDLYVVSGSGEALIDATGRDRLYINIGNNQFQKSTEHPQLHFNGSCVVKADFNHDGIDDLFVGGRSVPGSYGKYPASRILLGDGEGRLFDFTPRIFGYDFTLGMVTDAVWLDKSNELVVVGDWIPITFISFNGKEVSYRQLENTSGWWNTIEAADMDGDGDEDLLAGNRGLNSYLKASPDFPVSLYVKDFDRNASIDPILSYYHDEVEVPFYGMDELARQLVAVKKVYRTYKSYAQSTFREVFDKDELHGAGRWQVQTFESLFLENMGGGNFSIQPLPGEVQIAPIYGFSVGDFDDDGHQDILAVGNFYGNQVSIGKLDASYGHFLKGDSKGNWEVVHPGKSGFAVKGEARDIEQVSMASGDQLILVSRNNDKLKTFKLNQKKELLSVHR